MLCDFHRRQFKKSLIRFKGKIEKNRRLFSMVSEIWTEKYRPSKFNELVGQEDIVKRVESLTSSLNIPHLLFAGPAGTGKSTLALIIVKNLFREVWKENY